MNRLLLPAFSFPFRQLVLLAAAAAGAAAGAAAQGTPIGFAETWALSTDRAKALQQLIPGTPDHYYYSCRHLQDTGAFAEVEPLLQAWIQRHGRTQQVVEIENRQALLTFDQDPARTLRFLQERLGLRFDHQQQMRGAQRDLPTRLDPALVAPAAFTRRALQKHPHTVKGFKESAFEALLAGDLEDELLMDLLARLQRPDVTNLPALIVRNLQHRRSRGFGSMGIHKLLLQDQLDECVRLQPRLLNEQGFVGVYLLRLRPGDDSRWQRDAKVREAYLDRLQAFADRLAPAHNSLKAHVLYHRLHHDLAAGSPDKARFLAYLRLPRAASWVRPEFVRRFSRSGEIVDARRGFPTGLPSIGDDEKLVRTYLMHFFAEEDSFESYGEVVRADYLRRVFAETRILSGVGDMERWYSMLDDPAYYERLKERVEIDFAPTQRRHFAAGEPVSLAVDVKNVDKLLVKVFEINTFNYYAQTGREVDASINLDGLVANYETTEQYTESPLRRVRRTFDLAALQKPGVYVVELIGNGLSSRAVVHKGHLQYTERLGAAGHVITVRDQQGAKLIDAVVWFGGKVYPADKAGEVVLPYSTKPGRRTMILRHGELSSLARLQHQGESYELSAGIHLDRESLLSRRRARILVRPVLRLNGQPVALEVLEDPVLTIRARDVDGVESTLDVRDLKLLENKELVHEIQVPGRLSTLSVSLGGKVRNLSQGKTADLTTATRTFEVNAIDKTELTACPLLGRTRGGYVLDVLGKNGEPKAGRAVRLSLLHADYTDPLEVTLKTDEQGRIELGPLLGIEVLQASGLPQGTTPWYLRPSRRTYPSEVHGVAGATIRVPYLGASDVTTREAVSLIETRGGVFVRDAFAHVAISGGFVELRRLPPGDYDLLLKESRQQITVRVTAGESRAGWAVGADRMLELGGSRRLHVTGVTQDREGVRIELANAGDAARVHVVATRYVAPFDPFQDLSAPSMPGLGAAVNEHLESTYHSGREIGDEYRYILDRRFAKKYPGNMLERPGLILNPWALDEKAWNTAVGMGGGAGGRFGGRGGGRRPAVAGSAADDRRGDGGPGTFANLEFLPEPAVVVANLRPDANGVVSIAAADLGAGQMIHVVAVDDTDTVYTSLLREEKALVAVGRQLKQALDAERHFTEERRIEFVDKGGSAALDDAATAKAETYDSLAGVHRLFTALTGNADLAKFAFVLRWPKLGDEEKRELYRLHACHELHFFLHQKDPKFFADVVRPYLANKMDKTFLDDWLLGADLSGYVEPWRFARLNIVEKILLARRLAGESAAVRRHVRELFEVRPRDPALLARLFDSALLGDALDDNANKLEKKLGELRNELKDKAPAAPQARSERRSRGRAAGGEGAPAPDAAREQAKAQADEVMEEESEEPAEKRENQADAKDRREDLARRKNVRELYRAPDPTRALVEHNYWHRRDVEHVAGLVEVNGFWADFAEAPGDRPFVSTRVAEAAGSFAEMLLALAVLDLPFEAGEHVTAVEGARLTLRAATPLLLVRKELVQTEGAAADKEAPILVSQNYYRLDEPYRYEGNQRYDAYVTGEFLVDVAYGCRIVVTNPTSTPHKLELLMQIPQGSIPVRSGFFTKGVSVALGAYATSSLEYAFYFPAAGTMPHYPVHVARNGKLAAFGAAGALNVVPEPSVVDRTSWQYLSQNGSTEQVLAYVDGANLQRTDLAKIAWRMRDPEVFRQVTGKLRERKVYSDVLWSYGIHHGDRQVVREYLRHQDGFIAQCGAVLGSPVLDIDPVERHTYQHVGYSPLWNQRAHRFGKQQQIHNQHFAQQYHACLRVLGAKKRLDDADWMTVAYYLALQDRVEEALSAFARVAPANLPMRVQYDYMAAYFDFFTAGNELAAGIAARYKDYPVERWRRMFRDIGNQLAEASGEAVAQSDPDSRTQRQTALAAKEPVLGLQVENKRVTLRYENLSAVEVRYYQMDVEFLFSTQPFVQQGSGSFAFIKPNRQDRRNLDAEKKELLFDLPAEFLSSNVLIEVVGGGITRRQAYYANSLAVQWIESYGQLKVTHDRTGKPLPAVYVKVFARLPNGQVRFYKDGYTDLRGRFDYASVSAESARGAERFALLVLSDEHGAVIREVAPPAQ